MKAKKCPKCGGEMHVDENGIFVCPYCRFRDTEKEALVTSKKLDEAKKRIEEQQRIIEEKNKKIDSLERRIKYKEYWSNPYRSKKMTIGIVATCCVTALLVTIIALIPTFHRMAKESSEANALLTQSYQDSGYIKLRIDKSSWFEKNYQDVRQLFHSKGFTNVQTVGMDDLITGWVTKENTVENVTINGEDVSNGWHHRDSLIVISFHSFKNKTYEAVTDCTQFGQYTY